MLGGGAGGGVGGGGGAGGLQMARLMGLKSLVSYLRFVFFYFYFFCVCVCLFCLFVFGFLFSFLFRVPGGWGKIKKEKKLLKGLVDLVGEPWDGGVNFGEVLSSVAYGRAKLKELQMKVRIDIYVYISFHVD